MVGSGSAWIRNFLPGSGTRKIQSWNKSFRIRILSSMLLVLNIIWRLFCFVWLLWPDIAYLIFYLIFIKKNCVTFTSMLSFLGTWHFRHSFCWNGLLQNLLIRKLRYVYQNLFMTKQKKFINVFPAENMS